MKRLALILFACIALSAVKIVHADTFNWPFNTAAYYTVSDSTKVEIAEGMAKLLPIDQIDDDNTLKGFGGGDHNQTQWVTDHLELTDAGKTDGSGDFTSRVIDAGIAVSWETISWSQSPHNALFAVDNGEDVYRSIDGGNSWTEINIDFSGDSTDAVAIVHSSNKTLYIVDGGARVLSSTDEGVSWKAANLDYNGADSNNPEEVVFDDNDYIYIVETDDDVWRSTDLGATWTKVNDDYDLADDTSVRGMVSNATSIFIIAENEKIWKSDDNGTTWAELNSDYNMGDSSSPRVVSKDETYIYIAEDDEDIWRSDNWGVSFAKVCDDFNLTSSDNPRAMAWDEIDKLYIVTTEEDLYESNDFGESWTKISADFIDSDISGLNGFAAGIKFQVRTDDDNSNWSEFTGPDGTSSTFYSNPSSLLNVSSNQYFQYKAFFSTTKSSYTPKLQSVVMGPAHYPPTTPTVVNDLGQSYTSLTSFSEVLGSENTGNVEYQISNDNVHLYYWGVSSWKEQTGDGYPTETNTAAEINAVISSFDNDVGDGEFYFKAFLNSDGSQFVGLDDIQISYDTDDSNVTTTTITDSTDPPIIESLYPQAVSNTESSEVVIIGENFIETPEVYIGVDSIDEVTFVRSTQLEVLIPQGFTPGTYDVLVINPDDRCSILEDGITVEDPSPPEILYIFPDTGANDTTTDIYVTGINLKKGLTLQLGETESEVTFYVNSNLVTASVPSGIIPGVYDLVVTNPDDRIGLLEDAFTVTPSCSRSCNIIIFPDTLFGSRWLALPYIIFLGIEQEGYSFGTNTEILFDPSDDITVISKFTLNNTIVALIVVNQNPNEGLINLIASDVLVGDAVICEENNDSIAVTKEDALTINLLPWALGEETTLY